MEEPILSASNLVVRFGAQTVLDGATLALGAGDRVGLVGRNGCGKSTLLRIAAGALEADSGDVARKKNLVIGYLPQEFELDGKKTVEENILMGAEYLLGLIARYESMPHDSLESGDILDELNHFDGWNLESRVKQLVTHLGAPARDRIVGELSGGEKRRVALCRALVAEPDLLILDEPTNHLDTESIRWLENFLKSYRGSCLFVTHDRYFLDIVADRIVEISRGVCWSHPGNYTAYLEAKTLRQSVEEAQEHGRQKFLKRELEWIRRGPRARTTKSRDRVDRFYEIADKDAPEKELDVDLVIPRAPKTANKIIDVTDAGMELGGRWLFRGFSLKLQAGARIGIVGRNGLGKTTLLRMMIGEVEPSEGRVERGNRTEINYVDQARLLLDPEKTICEEVGENADTVSLGSEKVSLRGYLKRFLFTDERINSKIGLLSGGEKNRVVLAKILKRGGNVLVLDEPTNDLDLSTLRMIEEALTLFEGTVLTVSHDRYFLNRVCTGIIAFEGDGKVAYSEGDYNYYLEKRARAAEEEAEAVLVEKKEIARAKREPVRKLKWAEERELATIEDRILEAEGEVARLEGLFAAEDFYESHGGRWQELQRELEEAKGQVSVLYARWEELERIRKECEA